MKQNETKRSAGEVNCETVCGVDNAKNVTRPTKMTYRLYDGDFVGACLDTGAQPSVCDLS